MKSPIPYVLLLLTATSTLASAADEVLSTPDPAKPTENAPVGITYVENTGQVAQDPLQMESMLPSESPRHRQQKAALMERMNRHHGKWDTIHPRHRLLETLYGFTKYRERNMAELSRWRSLYKNVSKKQKQVLSTPVA